MPKANKQAIDDPQLLIDDRLAPKFKNNPNVGAVVGVIRNSQESIYSVGHSGNPKRVMLDGDTIFEIASISKMFTSLLLAVMVQRREVRLDSLISDFLPTEITLRGRAGQITLRHLATHTSGLPCLPLAVKRASFSNPYVNFSVQDLHQYLSTHRLRHDFTHSYSNMGFGLLGHLLTLKLKCSFEEAIAEEICRPLGLTDTSVIVPKAKLRRFAHGHDSKGAPISNWEFAALAGCAALRSTARDLLRFLAANLRPAQTQLAEALKLSRSLRVKVSDETYKSLSWYVHKQMSWHVGRSGGFATFAGFNRKRRLGLVVLSNLGIEAVLAQFGIDFLLAKSE